MGKKRNAYKLWYKNLRGRDHVGESDITGKII
jgi:hypothetical protein